MDKIHEVAPLTEVLFRGAVDDDTRYPRPPTPGPRWPELRLRAVFGTTLDESLPMGAPDEAFEKARVKK